MTKFAAFSDDTSAWGLIEGDALIALAQLPAVWDRLRR
jgi:hypothetical protein